MDKEDIIFIGQGIGLTAAFVGLFYGMSAILAIVGGI